MNIAIISGNLGKDCETLKSKTDGKDYGSFSVATAEYYTSNGEAKTKTTWHNVVMFSISPKLVEILKKGTSVIVHGKIDNREYEKDGQKRIYSSVIAEKVEITSKKQAPPESETKSETKSETGLPF